MNASALDVAIRKEMAISGRPILVTCVVVSHKPYVKAKTNTHQVTH